jgi:sirohydrochlorin cobaltochelatase
MSTASTTTSLDKTAIVLFAHGARDERWKEPFLKLQAIIKKNNPSQRVELSFLELMAPTLPELIDSLVAEGCLEILVIPVFFGQGGHMRRDFPAILAACQGKHPQVRLGAKAAVGEDIGVLEAIAKYCAN